MHVMAISRLKISDVGAFSSVVANPFAKQPQFYYSVIKWIHDDDDDDDDDDVDGRASCPRMSVDTLGTN